MLTFTRRLLVLSLVVFMVNGLFSQNFTYISPKPGSKYVNHRNNIAIRLGDVVKSETINNEIFNVRGSKSGLFSGKVLLATDNQTVIFKPAQPYAFGEKISVEVKSGLETQGNIVFPALQFDFTIEETDNTQMLINFYQSEADNELSMINEQAAVGQKKYDAIKINNNYPEDFPEPHVTELDNPSEGDVFCTLRVAGATIYNNYLAILDKYGIPLYYRKASDVPNDLKVIPNNRLAFCFFNNANVVGNAYYVMDKWFNVIDTLRMGNGYHIDQHDLLVQENGNRMMMAYDPQIVDMSQIVPDGDPNATVIGLVIQKLDSLDNVLFQWRSWDYFEITDAVDLDLTSDRIDYAHGNAFEFDDNETTLLISSRHMNEITKIDLGTGDIIWRMGLHATNNEFTFIDDTVGFCRQHDIRVLPNGNLTMYDNGNCHDPSFSQSREYMIDEVNKTMTPAWNFIHDPVIFGMATGSSRRQDDGNTLICWGFTAPIAITEVRPDGSLTWELNSIDQGRNYRAVKSTWQTNLFTFSQDSVDFGTYDDYVAWPKIILITNNSDQDIEITSTHNNLACYNVSTPLPLSIPAGETVNFTFQLFPTTEEGQLDDVLTLNYDSFVSDTLPQRISRQLFITAYVEDNNPPQASILPSTGTTDVLLDTKVMINFNESVVKANGSTLKSSEIPGVIEFRKTDANGEEVAFSAYIDAWKRQIVITPDALESSQQYFVKMKGNTVADKLGHVMTSGQTSTFTTADAEAPVAMFYPEDSTNNVVRNVIVTLTFNEPVYKSGGDEITASDLPSMFLFNETDTLGTAIAWTGSINDDKTIIYLVPDENLMANQQYYVALFGGMIQDASDNMIEEGMEITFTTGEEFGIIENVSHDVVQAYPNPNKGFVNIAFFEINERDLKVFDIKGKLVLEKSGIRDSQYFLNLSDQPNGVYLIRINNLDTNKNTEIKVLKK